MTLHALALSLMCAALPDPPAPPPAPPPLPPEEARKEAGFDAMGVPLLSFNSDLGVGYGAVGGGYFYGSGKKPYAHALAVQAFFTSRGIQNHWLRYDGPQLIGRLRFEARVEWRREFFTPYFGAGNVSEPAFNNDFSDRRFSYDRIAPAAWVRLRHAPFGDGHPFQPYLGYAFRWNEIRPYDHSLLLQEKPLGLEGGPAGQLTGGLIWDTRDEEGDPTRGGFEELGVRWSHAATASRYAFTGINVGSRRYFSLGTPWKLVFAQRLAADFLVGQVPFYEWTQTGGITYSEGIGGMSSVRGIPRNRYGGNVKVFSNSELRFYPLTVPFFGQPLKLGALLFVDVGRAWHPRVEDGDWNTWHTGMGAGLRVVRRSAVLRLDYAYAPEARRQGIYLAFGHMF
jgi:hypothetical protein